jgi:hypothetical protein
VTTESYVESIDACYDCKKNKSCIYLEKIKETIKETGLIELIIKECGDYE